ncbi:hypothetical protein PF010_g16898 [Phytophthora fragariae]|uniref:E2F/DP family winged-helix DNA-binding domain-containing protein n=2 Tax=Phytophthora TaxID=4783 RepID=A0A6A3T198_9STRA|nr:hypothetical protein PF011_g16740 [Phytophthora fragariae]KAE9045987.1 hypothetical protein PR002_g1912 [Phytophthora rubi]KAE9094958.1 hypothetical protein PF010_g16898 [Phytophthora fragariae]KAE9127778.1 hypothetical protein PF006_g16444 [Phytophthora fragariae]
MKTQRAHRRKLRFNSAKDAAPVTAARTERAPKQPVKRRTRKQRSRRVSPVDTRHSNATQQIQDLPSAMWSDVQDRLAAAKNLGELTQIMLQFFKRHEDLQGSASAPVFPIFVPASEIYKMKVPRKRRIYDVLNVLEGIGVIKRVRCVETRRTKGGFLYFGKDAVIQRLAEMQSNAAQVMVTFRQRRGLKAASITEEDSALVQAIEEKAVAEKWTGLTSTTVCFLSLLFQQDYQVGMAVPGMSERLVEAKKCIGALASTSPRNEPPYTDVQRRVYDAVSVLVACNLILTAATTATSVDSFREPTDKSSQRKHTAQKQRASPRSRNRSSIMALGKFIRHYLDREPMVVISCAIGAVAVSLPLVVVPIRRSMGLPTDQYDGPIIPDSIKKSRGHLATPEQ